MSGAGNVARCPRVSFLIATHDRREVLLHTLERVFACGLVRDEFEVLVVDNASGDGTVEAVRERFGTVILLPQPCNRGPCGKNVALAAARGEFVVFLDDDSFPEPGSLRRMIEHFHGDQSLGAAVFTVTLPDGSRECSAYPDVCIGCGTGFRRRAVVEAGGLPDDFFMAAEEYDLSLRLLDAGWKVRAFDDLHMTHLKTPASRFPKRIVRLDARNNLVLAMRYFPEPWRMPYAGEWLERYRLMAAANGNRAAFWAGAAEGLFRGMTIERRPISASAFEQFAKVGETERRLRDAMARMSLRRVLFIDLGKNILAYRLAARSCGLHVVGIADARLGGSAAPRFFRGVPLVSDAEALKLDFDAAVVSNLSPVHAARRLAAWRGLTTHPVIDLFAPCQGGELAAAA